MPWRVIWQSLVRIVVRTQYVLSIDELMRLGATEVVVEEFEASLELFARVLEFYETPTNVFHQELELVDASTMDFFGP